MLHTLKIERSYRKLFFAGIINGVGDRFSQVAVLSLLLQLTGSGLSVGITMALRMLPFLLFGPISGQMAAKWTRKKLLISTDFTRALIAILFLFVHSKEELWIIYTGSFLLACGEAFYGPTRKASLPAIVNANHLKTVNSWEQVSTGFILIVGALCGGIVSFFCGPKAAFIVNIFSFVAAGFMIGSIPSLEAKENPTTNHKAVKSPSFLPLLKASTFIAIIFSFDAMLSLVNGIENVLLSVYAVKTYHMGDLGVGILYSVLGTGFIVSPYLSKWISGKFLSFAFVCLFMEGVVLTVISQVGSFAFVVFLFGILTIFSGIGNTLLDTAVMQTIPAKWHGVYFGFSATIANTCIGISMFLTGLFLQYLSPRLMGLIGGILYIVLGAAYFILSLQIKLSSEHEQLSVIRANSQ